MTEIVEGREYRLLPDARWASSTHTDAPTGLAKLGTTRVRVDQKHAFDGNVWVWPVDGTRRDTRFLVLPKYLAPLDEPKPAPPDTRTPAEIIAKALDRAFVAEPAVWLHASVDIDPDGTWGVVVTLDPDVGYDSEYRLTLKEV